MNEQTPQPDGMRAGPRQLKRTARPARGLVRGRWGTPTCATPLPISVTATPPRCGTFVSSNNNEQKHSHHTAMSTTATTTAIRTKWALDPTHSELAFKVKHLMISNVKGEFQKFNASIEAVGTDFQHARVQATMDASSIFTNEENRDKHLRSADFFNAEQHPHLEFNGTAMDFLGDNEYKLRGDLTIKGITHPVTLDVEFGGRNTDPWGNEKLAFELHGRINRKDWGLNWNAALETGGVLVSDEVRISAELQFVKQA